MARITFHFFFFLFFVAMSPNINVRGRNIQTPQSKGWGSEHVSNPPLSDSCHQTGASWWTWMPCAQWGMAQVPSWLHHQLVVWPWKSYSFHHIKEGHYSVCLIGWLWRYDEMRIKGLNIFLFYSVTVTFNIVFCLLGLSLCIDLIWICRYIKLLVGLYHAGYFSICLMTYLFMSLKGYMAYF